MADCVDKDCCEGEGVSPVHEAAVLVEEKYSIILYEIKKSIYWAKCLINTFFDIEGNFFRKVFCFFLISYQTS